MENTNAKNNYASISLRDLLESLWKGKVIIAIFTAIAFLIAAVFTFFITPEKFESSTTLLTKPLKVSSAYSGEDAKGFADLESMLGFTPVQYAEKLKSNGFLKVLSDQINITNDDGNKITSSDLRDMISTTPDDKNVSVSVTVSDLDPDRAFAIASSIETSFLTYMHDFISKEVERYSTTLQENLEIAMISLDEKETSLNDYLNTNGSVELLTDEVERLKARVKDLNVRISRTDSGIASDLASLDAIIAELEPLDTLDESQLEVIAQLKQAIKENSYNELDSSLYIETNMINANSQVSQSIRLLEFNRLQMRLLNNHNIRLADLKVLEETEDTYYEKQQELTKVQPTYAQYKGEYDIALATYTSYLKRISAAKVYTKLDLVSSNISLLREPVKPTTPISPNKALNMAKSIIAGLILGALAVLAKEYWKNSKSSDDK